MRAHLRPGSPRIRAGAWALLIVLQAHVPAAAAPPFEVSARCGTAKAAAAHPWPSGALSEHSGDALPSQLKDAHLLERDAFGALPHVVFSEHFALKWGPDLEVDDEVAEAVTDVLEVVLEQETTALGFPLPAGSDLYFFNVYIGDSGEPAPPSLDVAGYFAHDDDDAPYLVFAPAALEADILPSVAAHELLHALQAAAGRFPYTTETAWFAEATAEWAIAQVFPADPFVGSLGFGMTLAPHLALNHYEPFAEGAGVGPYHPYGAFLFFQHAVDRGVAPRWVADLWSDEGQGGDPLDVIDQRLASDGLSAADLAPTMALANATYDYAFGEQQQVFDDEAEALFGEVSARVGLTVDDARASQWTRVPLLRSPQPLGYSVVALSAAAELEERVLRFDGDIAGEDGGLGDWHVWLLRAGADPEPLPLDDEGDVRVILEGAGELQLVASVTSEQGLPFERFSYRVLVGPPGEGDDVDPAPEPDGDAEGPPMPICGCAQSSGAPLAEGAGWAGLGLLLARLSARRRGRCRPASW